MASQPPEEDENVIVVTGSRLPKPTAEVRLEINIGGSSGGPNDPVFRFFRSLFSGETDFDLSSDFTAEQRKLIQKIIREMANDPYFAAQFQDLLSKNADINISPATRPEHVSSDAQSQIHGLDNGLVNPGASIRIYVKMTVGGMPISTYQFAVAVVHELVHALGSPAFTARLDAPGSDWDEEITRGMFAGYDFQSVLPPEAITQVIGDTQTPGPLVGTSHNQAFLGADAGNTFQPASGGHTIFPGLGANDYRFVPGATLSVIHDRGGNHVFQMGSGVSLSDLSLMNAVDGNGITLLAHHTPVATIQNARPLGPHYAVRINGMTYPFTTLSMYPSSVLQNASYHFDIFGEFHGGPVGIASVYDSLGINAFYRLGAVTGAYASSNWMVNENTGAITANFHKPDLGGEFTFLTLLAGNGASTAQIQVTVRWAYSGEMNPEL